MEFPFGLRHSIESGNCVLFVGAGIGAHLFDQDGNCAPDGLTLAKDLVQKFSIETSEPYDLAKISEGVEIRSGRKELEEFVRKRLDKLEPDELFQWLFSLRWRAIYTTNYDFGIQRAYELISEPQQKPITVATSSDLIGHNPRFDVPIYHIHGTLFGPSKPHIIITEEDYAHFREKRRMLFELLKLDFATSTILYIGYSNRDPNWKMLMDEISIEFLPSTLPQAYRIAPNTDALDVEILKEKKNITTINCTFGEFVANSKAHLDIKAGDFNQFEQLQKFIPPEFKSTFEKNPAPVIRLLDSWEYVNHVPFDEKPNVFSFLRGDRAN